MLEKCSEYCGLCDVSLLRYSRYDHPSVAINPHYIQNSHIFKKL